MTAKILVAGGAGFIGSNLCEKLLAEGKKVLCVDNFLTGRRQNIAHLLTHPNFEFHQHDILIPMDLKDDIAEIYNLACPASPPKYQQDPINTLKVNFIGVLNLLDLARAKGAKFLQSSTSEVYGEPEISPQHEQYRGNVNTVGIRSCYDEGKRVAETLVMEYHKQFQVQTRIVRIFNTYGPKMDRHDGRVVSNFIHSALNNQPISLYGKGDQTRSFCYIDDQIAGLMKLMAVDYAYPVNIGNPHEITVLELAVTVLRLTESESTSPLVYADLPLDDPTNRKPDISKAKELLQWEPTWDLERGLRQTIAYFKDLKG